MAVIIRLSRAGRVHLPFYHIGVFDRRTRRDGRPIEEIGFYDPESKKETLRVDVERARHWLAVGADVSATVKSLLKTVGVAVAADAAKARLAKAAKAPAAKKLTDEEIKARREKGVAASKKRGVKKRKAGRTANSKKAAEKKRPAAS